MVKVLINILLLSIISLSGVILYNLEYRPKKYLLANVLAFPKGGEDPFLFTEASVWQLARTKNLLKIELDGNNDLNLKKLDIIAYETRKIVYANDTTKAILIDFTDDTSFSSFNALVQICQNEGVGYYSPVKRGFIIFGYKRK